MKKKHDLTPTNIQHYIHHESIHKNKEAKIINKWSVKATYRIAPLKLILMGR